MFAKNSRRCRNAFCFIAKPSFPIYYTKSFSKELKKNLAKFIFLFSVRFFFIVSEKKIVRNRKKEQFLDGLEIIFNILKSFKDNFLPNDAHLLIKRYNTLCLPKLVSIFSFFLQPISYCNKCNF